MKKLIPILIIALCSVAMANGMPEDSGAGAVEGAYTIKEGDTLWDISSEKLKDPFLWPRIWKSNPYIKNPDLIFPGDKLNIPGEPAGEQEREVVAEKKEQPVAAQERAGKTVPVTTLAARNIPVQKKAYLTTREMLLRSGYITKEMSSTGKVLSSLSGAVMLAAGDPLYVAVSRPAKKGDKFYVMAKPVEIDHPASKKLIGYLNRVIGTIEIAGVEDGNIKAVTIQAYEEITAGDPLIDFYPVEVPVEPDSSRRPSVGGFVVKVWNDQLTGGSVFDAVYLDRGTEDGVMVGDVFNVTAGKQPTITIGTVQVITAKDKTSVAVVKKAVNEIQAGDLFKN